MILKKIRLDQLLFERKLAESKSKAKAMIMAGQVYVEDKLVNKSGFNLKSDAVIKIKDIGPEWVSRGAIKILHAVQH